VPPRKERKGRTSEEKLGGGESPINKNLSMEKASGRTAKGKATYVFSTSNRKKNPKQSCVWGKRGRKTLRKKEHGVSQHTKITLDKKRVSNGPLLLPQGGHQCLRWNVTCVSASDKRKKKKDAEKGHFRHQLTARPRRGEDSQQKGRRARKPGRNPQVKKPGGPRTYHDDGNHRLGKKKNLGKKRSEEAVETNKKEREEEKKPPHHHHDQCNRSQSQKGAKGEGGKDRSGGKPDIFPSLDPHGQGPGNLPREVKRKRAQKNTC